VGPNCAVDENADDDAVGKLAAHDPQAQMLRGDIPCGNEADGVGRERSARDRSASLKAEELAQQNSRFFISEKKSRARCLVELSGGSVGRSRLRALGWPSRLSPCFSDQLASFRLASWTQRPPVGRTIINNQ